MESNITDPEYFDNEALTEPHFDEEATIAAARPVVPLEEIKAEPNYRRFALGLAILGALIVGTLGGTFIYKQRHSKPAAEIVDLAVTGSGASSQEMSEQPITETQTPNVSTGNDAATVSEAEPSQPVVSNRRPTRTIAQPEPVYREESISREDRKEARRLARIEARRARRAERQAEREDWGRRKSSDDLLRIREIFEGPRRP